MFGQEYASIYDKLHQDHVFKDGAEAIDQIISDYLGKTPKRSLLDVGCGTGQHLEFLKHDYDVSGLDLSADMLNVARARSPQISFHQDDAKTFEMVSFETLRVKYDVITMMSSVLGYQHSNDDVLETLRNMRRHLNTNGLLIFDVLNGSAILLEKLVNRVKEVSNELIKVIQFELDIQRNLCFCIYKWWLNKDGQMIKQTETHIIRYFFPMELRLFLQLANFKILKIGVPGNAMRCLDDSSRHMMFVCQAM